jgi:hypothetical protein
MDFFGGLPMTHRGHDFLFDMVDRFNKLCLLIPCKKTISRREAIELFLKHVWVHFRFPTSVMSNRDNKFFGKFWTTLWEIMDTNLNYSTAFHLQTDGQTEVVNMTLV